MRKLAWIVGGMLAGSLLMRAWAEGRHALDRLNPEPYPRHWRRETPRVVSAWEFDDGSREINVLQTSFYGWPLARD